MPEFVPATRDRILEGALAALGRVGPRRLTMSDVSERAGLSRGTVYRYFPTKEDLLAVLAEYEQDRFADELRRSLHEGTEEPTLANVAEYVIGYLRRHPALPLMIDIEPEFVLIFLRRQMPVFHRITEELLGPVMARSRPVQEGLITVPELDDLLLRVVLSVFLVPGEEPTVGALEGALDGFLRLAGAGPAVSSGGTSRAATRPRPA
ncbi:MAG TPA: TetR/AcrR family transcriptional regulator [Acidimicrobiales bacterium]|nr:TetR/AcrR family transcriptional regulator [Acidimicrobiales bacterium]